MGWSEDDVLRKALMRRSLGCAAVTALALALPAPALAADVLPDLGMARVSDLKIDKSTIKGHKLLRYTAIIVNVGAGPFEARGGRSSTSEPTMAVTQRIYDDAGGHRDLTTSAEMFYAGDGHNHWHVRDLETGELTRLDNGVKTGTLAKHGFCFYDNYQYRLTLPGAPQSPVYTNCGSASSLNVTMGLSIGWGDAYYWNTAYQYIDITGLSNGHYRLTSSAAPPSLGFQESDTTNNATWVDIALRNNTVRVLAYGPAA
jgi:hypothetical protein